MTTIRKIVTSKIDGDNSNNNTTNEIRPYGELAVYVGDNSKLELLMFDGVRTHLKSKVFNKGTFFGGDADSSDNLNRDTIKLVPDEELRRNGSDQYLVIDPTIGEPGHIHIRAGGAIDNSGADLFLGGELNNVRVSDIANRVTISTGIPAGGGATNNWQFGWDGNIILPEGGSILDSTGNSVLGGTLDSVTDRGAVTTNNITVGSLATTDINNVLSAQIGNRVVNVPPPEGAGIPWQYIWISSGPEVQALIALGDLTGYTVTQTNVPGQTITVLGMVNLGGTLGIEVSDTLNFDPENFLTFTSPGYVPSAEQPIDITVSGNTWTFSTDGNLVLPGGGNITGNDYSVNIISGNDGVALYGDVNITTSNPIATNTWSFGTAGELSLPNGSVIEPTTVDNFGSTFKGILLTPDPEFDTGQGLRIYPTSAEQGHLHITANDPSTVNLFLGDDDQYVRLGPTGEIEISAQNGLTLWGEGVMSNAYLILPNNTDSISTAVALGNVNGDVLIQTSETGELVPNNWLFGTDGVLTFPTNGNIVFDSSANSFIHGISSIVYADNTVQTTAWTGSAGPIAGTDTQVIFNDSGVAGANAGLTFNKTTGTLTANNFVGNITPTSNITGTSSNVTLVAGSYSWNFDNTGNTSYPSGIVTFPGRVTTGVYALDVGVNAAFLSNTVTSFTANVNSYTQITLQNINTGADATADYILTADNGSDTVNYGDLGIINSGYDNATPTNSLGNIVYAGDTYLYAQGNVSNTAQSGGNLAIGTTVAGKTVRIFAGGTTSNNIVANISSAGIAVTGNLSVSGNITGTVNGFSIGYRDIPQVSFSANTTLALSDAGKHYYSTQSTSYILTIPNNASVSFSIGSAVNIINQGTGNITVAQGSGVTLYFAGNSTAGNRTLSSYGMATVQKVATDTWFIVGVGVS